MNLVVTYDFVLTKNLMNLVYYLSNVDKHKSLDQVLYAGKAPPPKPNHKPNVTQYIEQATRTNELDESDAWVCYYDKVDKRNPNIMIMWRSREGIHVIFGPPLP